MEKKLGKLIADVWEDPGLAKRLAAEPLEVLAEYGVAVPAGKEVVPLFATEDLTFVVLPRAAATGGNVVPLKPLHESPGQDPLALVIASKAATDARFRDLLLEDVRAALEEMGLGVPGSHEVRVVENTDSTIHFVVPTPPRIELKQEDLERIAGGGATCTVTFQSSLELHTVVTWEAAMQTTTELTTEESSAETTAEVEAEVALIICAT